ncbi:MAG: cobalamin-dependent protein [Eubacterium sp.]
MEQYLIDAVVNIDEPEAIRIVETLVSQGVDSKEISNDLNNALQRVAKRYECGEYYIADLIMAGELVTNLLKQSGMESEKNFRNTPIGKIAVGTVFDDIHDVGKNIFVSMLRSEGFDVLDLGTDVSVDRFIKMIKKEKPNILGISGILTSVVENIRVVIDAIEAEGLRNNIKIILGGALANKDYANYVGADCYSSDAIQGVKICKEWLTE